MSMKWIDGFIIIIMFYEEKQKNENTFTESNTVPSGKTGSLKAKIYLGSSLRACSISAKFSMEENAPLCFPTRRRYCI